VAPLWLSSAKAIAQSVAGALPALILVIFAGLLALLGLVCEEGRRTYALAYADRFVDLAAVLVGRPRHAPRSDRPLRRPLGEGVLVRNVSPSANRDVLAGQRSE
jgi:hypothetical protein